MPDLLIHPDMTVLEALRWYGPITSGPVVSPEQAIDYCRGLANSHYENFSVLSALVPDDLRDDFAAVYAFCRWSDDLGDETGHTLAARAQSMALLNWWEDQLDLCFDGLAEHPVFIALHRVIDRHAVPKKPFADLISAFKQDQSLRHYQTWDQVLDYCTRSANPVGRIVLHLGGYPDTPENTQRYRLSDATCTALQLTNFWQDVRRDLIERDRVYIPLTDAGLTVAQLRDWMLREFDPDARVPFIRAMHPLVDKTRALFDDGRPLPGLLDGRISPVVWLFGAGGRSVLRSVERIGCATLWQRPRLSKSTKVGLVAGAWLRAKLGGPGRPLPGHGPTSALPPAAPSATTSTAA
ncbi:MAG: squalene synthase HpnC [Phycisphaerales bacterium]